MHPLCTWGYKSLLVLVKSLQNDEEDLHACIFKYTEREREGERTAIILVELFRRKMIEIRILKNLRREITVSQNVVIFQLSFLQMRQGVFLKNRFYVVFEE